MLMDRPLPANPMAIGANKVFFRTPNLVPISIGASKELKPPVITFATSVQNSWPSVQESVSVSWLGNLNVTVSLF